MAYKRTEDHWSNLYWFGSLGSLADAAAAAYEELVQSNPAEDSPVTVRITVHTADGYTGFESTEELQAALDGLERELERINGFSCSISTLIGTASIHARDVSGIDVNVESERASLAHGLTTTLQRKLQPGVDRVRIPPLPPRPAREIINAGVGSLLALGLLGFVIYGGFNVGWDSGIWILLPLPPLLLALWLLAALHTRFRPHPKHLELVTEAEETKPAPPPDDRGPILRLRDWLRGHPVLTVLGSLILALVGAAIAHLWGGENEQTAVESSRRTATRTTWGNSQKN